MTGSVFPEFCPGSRKSCKPRQTKQAGRSHTNRQKYIRCWAWQKPDMYCPEYIARLRCAAAGIVIINGYAFLVAEVIILYPTFFKLYGCRCFHYKGVLTAPADGDGIAFADTLHRQSCAKCTCASFCPVQVHANIGQCLVRRVGYSGGRNGLQSVRWLYRLG